MLIKLLTTILIFSSLIKAETSADLIKETRGKIAGINLSFLENKYPENNPISELGKLIDALKQEKGLPKIIHTGKDRILRLIDSYKSFEKFFRNKREVDTLKEVFRVVNNEFNALFGNYFLDELKNSTKEKIIIFSTSLSCECTLEMCYKQECEIQKLQKENPGLFDYAVVDSYSNYDLQNKYEVGFIPAVIVANKEGKEIKRFVRNENLYNELNSILKIKGS